MKINAERAHDIAGSHQIVLALLENIEQEIEEAAYTGNFGVVVNIKCTSFVADIIKKKLTKNGFKVIDNSNLALSTMHKDNCYTRYFNINW